MKKVIKSALIGIVLLGIINLSNNPILKFGAKKLLAPYYIVGIIMLIGSFFSFSFGRKGGRLLHKIVSIIMLLSSVPIIALPFSKTGNNTSFSTAFNWPKFGIIISTIIGSIVFIALLIFLIKAVAKSKQKAHSKTTLKTCAPKPILISQEENITDTQQENTTIETTEIKQPQAKIKLVDSMEDKDDDSMDAELQDIFEIWDYVGGKPFKAISTYDDIEWVKIYKDPNSYDKVYGWIKMKNACKAYNREIFYVDCKCWTLVEVLNTKAA